LLERGSEAAVASASHTRVYTLTAVMTTVEDLDRRFYLGYVDEHARFDKLIRRYLQPGAAVLDVSAGRGIKYPYDYRSIVGRMAGVDIDPAVTENANLTDAAVADLASLPYAEGEFDLVFSKYVFEHLERPVAAMRELRRVLKPGGHLLIHTPNRWHYVAMFATLTPTKFHEWFNEKRGRVEADTFPTRYRANSKKRLAALACGSGFRVVDVELLETKPDYLYFHPWPYLAGIAYERLVDRFDALAGVQVQLLADLQAI
jgi:SAM-dependent methyltransferase